MSQVPLKNQMVDSGYEEVVGSAVLYVLHSDDEETPTIENAS
jgi:hypothetical protein